MAADPAVSVRDIAAFGQNLGNLCWIDCDRLRTVHDTTGLLQELQALIDVNSSKNPGHATGKLLTQTGHQELETLAVKCDLLYKTLMLLIQKAADRTKPSKENTNAENMKDELLGGPVPNPSSLKSLGLLLRSKKQQNWLEPRIVRCMEQLEWVEGGLLILLTMAKLAALQISSVEREAGTLEQEVLARGSIHRMRSLQVKWTKRLAKSQERAQRRWELQASSNDTDTSSVSSSASSQKTATTTGTAVDDEDSSSKNDTPVVKVDTETTQDNQKPTEKETVEVSPGKPTVEVVSAVDVDLRIPDQQYSTFRGTTEPEHTGTSIIGQPIKQSCSLSSSVQLNLKLPQNMVDWIRRMFGKDDEFKQDWESQSIEAYVLQKRHAYPSHIGPNPVKVPFGHRRLHYGLNKVVKDKDKPGSTWNRYIDLGSRMHSIIDEVVREANRLQRRERVCVAFQEYSLAGEDPFTLVFFSIREEKKPVLFKDTLGKTYVIPFETCRTWTGMEATIIEASKYMSGREMDVLDGHYDILGSNGDIILPGLWSNTIKPGETYPITEEEDKQLKVIDFVEELEKTKDVTIDDLLARFTNVKDTLSEDCFKGIFTSDSGSDSDSEKYDC